MAKNERIIAQDLAELRHALQVCDRMRLHESCEILAKEIKKYPVKPDILDKLEMLSKLTDYDGSSKFTENKINEITVLIDILVSC